jgi:hypothetical protein
MDSIADVVLYNPYGDEFGSDVSFAGDINNDGYDDVIVGDYYGGNKTTGLAYVFYGDSLMDNTADIVLTGEAWRDEFGYSVSRAGDVNNDGYSDVIVGAPMSSAAGIDRGRAYIYSGTNPTLINDINIKHAIQFQLFQNYPNPFNPITVISWQLAVSSDVDLSVYNILGQKVITIVSEKQTAGYHEVEFNGQNLSSGVYLLMMKVGDPARRTGTWHDVKKMILIR